jgi:hypothetical protein
MAYTREQLERMDTADLDRMAFGFASGDVVEIQPIKISIVYHTDMEYARADAEDWCIKAVRRKGRRWDDAPYEARQGLMREWAEGVYARVAAKNNPAEVWLKNGQFELQDGHHRFLAAATLGKPLLCEVTVKDNPIDAILKKQGEDDIFANSRGMNWYKIAKETQEVWLEGELKQTSEGFVYLDVPGHLITAFLGMIPDRGVEHPREASDPYAGAHISVIKRQEAEGKKIREVGRRYQYRVKGVEKVKPGTWDGVDTVYFVTVDAPDLEKLRQRHGLSKKISGHDFHITVGLVQA